MKYCDKCKKMEESGLDLIDVDEYPFKEGDRVVHIKDPDWTGVIIHIDRNLPHPTTCEVLWDGYDNTNVHWTNKLSLINE
ncbi:MAG: hypothetical protein BV456_07610 [Thermoplasmata archaeon M8B2D]|nr:MAG: hypothetical protein BV456_07610 [Thermoplasmata archaeon M8B2D]